MELAKSIIDLISSGLVLGGIMWGAWKAATFFSYKYDAENGYIVKDAKKYFRSEKIKNYFDFYLSDTFLDRDRFTEKIEILD